MFPPPPMPSWDGLHPLIIHFPIALLMIAPLFVLLGAALPPRKSRPVLMAALLLMIIGTAFVFFAIATGEAAGKIAGHAPKISAILGRHEELADRTRTAFSVLTMVFAAIVLIPGLLRRAPERICTTVLPLTFLLLYAGATLLLANTAHNGGRLVHEFGVRAMVAPSPLPGPGK